MCWEQYWSFSQKAIAIHYWLYTILTTIQYTVLENNCFQTLPDLLPALETREIARNSLVMLMRTPDHLVPVLYRTAYCTYCIGVQSRTTLLELKQDRFLSSSPWLGLGAVRPRTVYNTLYCRVQFPCETLKRIAFWDHLPFRL